MCLLAVMLVACAEFHEPLHHSARRATPLSFGVYVTPDQEHNPITPPERFTGYHVGTDFEVTEDELDMDVTVTAICTGTGVFSGFVEGYGGLFVEECMIKGEDVIVLYGHMTREGLARKGDAISAGQSIGLLAPARSVDSDGNRKHLHLGIRKGKQLDIRGYVQSEKDIALFIDPQSFIPFLMTDAIMQPEEPYWDQDAP